jgi:hypothetical protein
MRGTDVTMSGCRGREMLEEAREDRKTRRGKEREREREKER